MYCGKCGVKLNDDAKFCHGCGNKIKENDFSVKASEEKSFFNFHKQNHKKVGLLVVLGITLLIGLFLFFRDGDNKAITKEDSVIEEEQEKEILLTDTLEEIISEDEEPILKSKEIHSHAPEMIEREHYDENGGIILSALESNSGLVTEYNYVVDWEYNGNEAKGYYEGAVVFERVFDDEGNLVEETKYSFESKIKERETTWEYKDKKMLGERERLFSAGEAWRENITNYDEYGNVVYLEIYVDDVGKETWTYDYEYNKSGQIIGKKIKTVVMQHGGLQEEEITFKYNYDEKGNLISVYSNSINGEVLETEYVYDEAGNLMEQWEYIEGNLYSIDEYEYDDDGNVIANYVWYEDDIYNYEIYYTYYE